MWRSEFSARHKEWTCVHSWSSGYPLSFEWVARYIFLHQPFHSLTEWSIIFTRGEEWRQATNWPIRSTRYTCSQSEVGIPSRPACLDCIPSAIVAGGLAFLFINTNSSRITYKTAFSTWRMWWNSFCGTITYKFGDEVIRIFEGNV